MTETEETRVLFEDTQASDSKSDVSNCRPEIKDQSDQKDLIEKYNANCKAISALLYENAGLYQAIDDPEALDKCRFPAGVIETVAQIKARYPLEAICLDPLVIDHIAYSMELHDLLSWMDRTFHFYGAIEVTLHKHILINLISIMEALVMEAGKKAGLPQFKAKMLPSEMAAKTLVKAGILDQDIAKSFTKLYKLRNRVHLRASKQNEIIAATFNRTLSETCPPVLEKLMTALADGLKRFEEQKAAEAAIDQKNPETENKGEEGTPSAETGQSQNAQDDVLAASETGASEQEQ